MRVVLFSGTTEGRELSRRLAELGLEVTVSVATPLGQEEQGSAPGVTVRCGRLLPDEMAALLKGAALCIDATHPYAVEATKNIRAAAESAGVGYLRLLRPASPLPEGCLVFGSAGQAAEALSQKEGNLLLATGAKELAQSNVKPTLKDAVAGDITAAMPYRAMTNIIEFIKMLDMVVPGFAANETLLYSPELKFYSNKVKMDENLDTNIQGLHCLGDSSGWTRGLMMASVMGVLMGRKLAEKEGC